MAKKCCVCDALPEVLPKKKSSTGKKLFKLLAFVGVTIAAVKSLKRLITAKKEELNRSNQYRDTKEYLNVFDGQTLVLNQNDEVRDLRFKTICSGVKLDLSNADIQRDVSLELISICSGVDLHIPEGVNVQVDCKSFAGGVDNPIEYTPGAPTIFISGINHFSGLRISVGDITGSEE